MRTSSRLTPARRMRSAKRTEMRSALFLMNPKWRKSGRSGSFTDDPILRGPEHTVERVAARRSGHATSRVPDEPVSTLSLMGDLDYAARVGSTALSTNTMQNGQRARVWMSCHHNDTDDHGGPPLVGRFRRLVNAVGGTVVGFCWIHVLSLAGLIIGLRRWHD